MTSRCPGYIRAMESAPSYHGRVFLGALLLACICARAAAAQVSDSSLRGGWRVDDAVLHTLQATAPRSSSDLANSVIIATIGSAVGVFGGGFLGYSIDRARGVPSEDPGLNGFIYGALVTSALLTPSLLYVANRQGSWPRAVLLSAAGTAFAALAFRDLDRGLLIGPVIQVGISVALLH